MGERTFVSERTPAATRTIFQALRLNVDLPLVLITVTLLVFGLVMLFSASWDYSRIWFGSTTHMFERQILWVLIGTVSGGLMTIIDYRIWKRLALPLMGVTVVLLLLVFTIGELRLNAVRSLTEGSVQPSELAKLATIIYLAVWLNAKRDQLDSWGFGIIPLGVILGIVGGLIFMQPDLSAAITIFALGGLMFFLAGGDLRQIAILLFLAVISGYLVVNFTPTGRDRLDSYLAGRENVEEASYHVQRALEAFARGGWLGAGIGQADTKLTGLPHPPTDSIYAVIGEEAGVFGAAALVVLYLLFLWRALVIARRAPDELGRLLAAGLGIWIVMEALINMSVIIGLLPFAGNALPFISAGGSNLIVVLTSVGFMLNVSRQPDKQQEEKERIFNAFVDLRRRDRRRRVSRVSRPASSEAAGD